MSIRKRNEFLDDEEDDEEIENDYDSEPELGRGAIGRHSSKRRKTNADPEQSPGALSEDEDERENPLKSTNVLQSEDARFNFSKFGEDEDATNMEDEGQEEDQEEDEIAPYNHDRIKADKQKSSAAKQAEKAQKAVRKSGVVYISRVPPFMKPQTLKHFLEPHARKGLGRVFLTPEDNEAHTKRVKNGGNKKKSFTDGWVEFASKTEAKLAAEMLNGNIIGGKKSNFYHDDLWNMKYLKGFKWHHLTEQIANENAERTARMREEIRRSRKENKTFADDVERAKMLDGMENKRKVKRERAGLEAAAGAASKPARDFRQWKAQSHDAKGDTTNPLELNKALRKVF